MKLHIGRFAIGGIVVTFAWVIFWLFETFPVPSKIIMGIVAVLAFSYLIGSFIIAVWENDVY